MQSTGWVGGGLHMSHWWGEVELFFHFRLEHLNLPPPVPELEPLMENFDIA